MGEQTKIQWCDHTFSPWVGCEKVSPGCKNCYAAVDNPARIARGRGLELWGHDAARQRKADSGWREPERWFRKAVRDGVRRRVFCASQCDVFEDRRDLDVHRERLWALIETTANEGSTYGILTGAGLDWLLLTKRPEHIMRLIPERWRAGLPPNVWVGTSVEDEAATARLDALREVPAVVRFVSFEPLLEAVRPNLSGIAWAIVGGESGGKARPCALEWIEDLVAQCREAGVAPFVKQLGAVVVSEERAVEDPAEQREFGLSSKWAWRAGLRDSHGGDPAEWPADLRVREFPIVRHPGAPEPPPLSPSVEEALGP